MKKIISAIVVVAFMSVPVLAFNGGKDKKKKEEKAKTEKSDKPACCKKADKAKTCSEKK